MHHTGTQVFKRNVCTFSSRKFASSILRGGKRFVGDFFFHLRKFPNNGWVFLKTIRNFLKNGWVFHFLKRNFPRNGWGFLKKKRRFSPQKRLFLIRTVSYERGTPCKVYAPGTGPDSGLSGGSCPNLGRLSHTYPLVKEASFKSCAPAFRRGRGCAHRLACVPWNSYPRQRTDYMGTSLIRKCTPLGPYRWPVPKVLGEF